MHRILIIDDNEAIHGDFRKILAGDAAPAALTAAKAALFGAPARQREPRVQFEVASALQGKEGLEKLQAAVAQGRPFALAFVDMRMPPGWNGLQTIQRLWDADPDLQVVICTAYSDHSWDEISQTLGLTDRLLILKKPFDPVEVLQLAAALTEKWALRKQACLKLDELERLVEQRTSELTYAARYDRLTGLPNRPTLKDELAKVLRLSPRSDDEPFAVYFLDFDRFKAVNDSLGHDAGDQLLAEIGRRLNACLEADACRARCAAAMAARLGGDEFAVIARALRDQRAATDIADQLLAALAEPYALGGYTLSVTASIGITTSDMGYEQPDEALRDADTAMYHAKAAGKARYVLFDHKMHAAARERLALENDLRGVAERGELRLHYQPVFRVATGELTGFEALARWEHPRRGMLPPAEFIPCAEEAGAMGALGRWVLEQACRQLAEWRRSHPRASDLVMSVNVSATQLALPHFVEHVESAIAAAGIDPRRLALEITESAVIADPGTATPLLQRLRALGVLVYMDDFGTGYSSLSYLHTLPLSALKMDRSFMSNVSERRDYAAVIRAIIELARNLGIDVVAEGVESPEQVAMLQALECDYAQGFLFSRPVEAAAATELLSQHFSLRAAA